MTSSSIRLLPTRLRAKPLPLVSSFESRPAYWTKGMKHADKLFQVQQGFAVLLYRV